MRYLTIVIALALFAAGGVVAYGRLRPEPAPVLSPVVQAPAGPVHAVIGSTAGRRPINAYTYGTGATRLLFVGGMHGGYEWNTVVLAWQYKAYLDAHPDAVPAEISITLIPDLNADGTRKVVDKDGPITQVDILADVDTVPGRTNADHVDLNRNFDCRWQSEGTWRSAPVSGGTAPFSEPESAALRDLIEKTKPAAVVFWHSQSGSVYASECDDGILSTTLDIMQAYADASGYRAVKSFDAYPVTGDAEGWLASIGIPAITVELTNHTDVEWDKNLAGIRAIVSYFQKR